MSIKEIHYTICPVGNASFIAANKGWIKAALRKYGVVARLLQSLPRSKWGAHYDYQDDILFREGGNIPPIWAKANGAKVVLIGLTFLTQKSYILVREDSPIESVEDLKGRKLGIPSRPKFSYIDFHQITAQHGFTTALAVRGISLNTVQFVELPVDETYIASTADKKSNLGKIEAVKLENGEVDAIYAGGTFAQKLLATGKYKVIFELTANPQLISPINNAYPNILTVSEKLASEAPEIVVAYVKQLILASEWAKNHRLDVLKLFAEQTHGTIEQVNASVDNDFNKKLAPELSPKGLAALETQKRFLFDHGYIQKDFAIEKWADNRFLKSAWQEINETKSEHDHVEGLV
ncbi:MAG: ABC transporter substrate-binding protein [Sporolactobacillus sp.]|jgi:2'-hydroxybiphenyl-2-sulfinate desulfinase|nr:ABC transporter substrate-binding protein [Sporolactobacillus sp.]